MLKYNDEQLRDTLFWQVHMQELHTVVLLLCCVFAIMQKKPCSCYLEQQCSILKFIIIPPFLLWHFTTNKNKNNTEEDGGSNADKFHFMLHFICDKLNIITLALTWLHISLLSVHLSDLQTSRRQQASRLFNTPTEI